LGDTFRYTKLRSASHL